MEAACRTRVCNTFRCTETACLLGQSADGVVPAEKFKDLVDHEDDVSILAMKEFDANGSYDEVVEAVRKASGSGDARVYRVKHGKTRAEYYVVALDKKGKRVVGLKAKAVES